MATKKLSASNLKQIHSKKFTTKKLTLDVEGSTYEILIDEKFKVTKLQSLISELFDKQKFFTEIQEVFSIVNYIPFLIIKHFTNLDLGETKDFAEELKLYEILLDLGIAEKILSNFDEKEMQKINEYMKKASENLKKFSENKDALQQCAEIMSEIDEDFVEYDTEESEIDEGVEDA